MPKARVQKSKVTTIIVPHLSGYGKTLLAPEVRHRILHLDG